MLLTPILLLVSSVFPGAVDGDLATVAGKLQAPPREYTSGPLWVWNDLLTTEQVTDSLNALADQGIRQVWVHPRPGLMTPYLSDAWFARWEDTLKAARERDMLVWIYDENSYPSGFAGGYVPEAMPESRGLGLSVEKKKTLDPANDKIYAIYSRTADGYKDVTKKLKKKKGLVTDGDYVVARMEEAKASPWYGGKFHTDLLRKGVTDKFLEITLDAYKKRLGDEFGKMVPGSFTDEPHLKPCGDIHWTPDLPEQFKARWGYEFNTGLPYLNDDSAKAREFRHNYFQVINDLFVERWAKPYYEYCEKNGLEFTGHYWEHSWPGCASVPDNMAMAAWQQRPGIDILFNQYDEGVHAQFGNVRAVLELASVANQTGRQRTLSETYGGSSAEMTFQDYKRIGDWEVVLGVNTINEHLSDVTMRGARKRDYPPTFSYHSPWMSEYHVLVNYFARVSYALSQGKQINPVLLLSPTTTAWMRQFGEDKALEALGDSYQALVVRLAKEQVEFDVGDEHIMMERGSVVKDGLGKAALRVGERDYSVVVIPESMENLNKSTVALLKSYLDQGGVVLSCAGPDQPSCIDGKADDACKGLRTATGWQNVKPEEVAAKATALCAPTMRVVLDADNKGIVYHHRRQMSDGDLVFITNTSNDVTASGSVITAAKGVREVNLDTGAIVARAAEAQADGTLAVKFTLPVCGSVMLFLDKTPAAAPTISAPGERKALPVNNLTARRMDDNNLILDYVDVTAGGETLTNIFWQKAAELTFKKNGLRGNIWDHAVQFGDELLKTPFAADSGFEATYHFTIEGAVPQRLFAVVERPDIYTITCNGTPVSATAGEWWIDRAFGRIDIAKAARAGGNTLTIKASPMNVFHELEAAHIVGDFGLKAADKGFVIVPAAPLALGDWTKQGLPMYGHRVSYTAEFKAPKGGRCIVSLPSWQGVVAKVLVNGKDAGRVYRQPMECDVTDQVKPGKNTVEVVLYGSLRNPLGPHLGNKDVGITHPGSWSNAPESPQPAGAEYFSVPYGLTTPFEVFHSAS
jgi:hypothetical protein